MNPGPKKSFDPQGAVVTARELFWQRGYDAVGIRDLEAAIGIGRKSLYDTFGSKRELYLLALESYAEAIIGRICDGLEGPGERAMKNLERVLRKLQAHHGAPGSFGCLLGVAMGQSSHGDEEIAALLRRVLDRMERAFEGAIRGAQGAGDARTDVSARDAARQLVAFSQGMALMGRIADGPGRSSAACRAALQFLRLPAAPTPS